MKTKTKYIRKGQTIEDLETGKHTDHKTINAAKRASHKLQEAAGGHLGSGVVRVG